MEPRTVSEVLDQLEAGTMSRDQAVAWARTHAWPPVSMTPVPSTGNEVFRSMTHDPPVMQRESFAEVALALDMHRIDGPTYGALAEAYVAGQADNRPPPRRR